MSRHDFRTAAKEALSDERLGAAVRYTADLLIQKRAAAVAGDPGFDELRDWGRARKREVSGALEEHARAFASRLEAQGGKAHFAKDADEVGRIASKVAGARRARSAVKAKSMTSEEVALNEALSHGGVEVTETDLGEFIIQLAGEKPSHILGPALHKDRTQVGELFARVLGVPADLDISGLVAAARTALRERFLTADLGITGANFAVAETGTIVIVTNEGNGRMATSLPAVHLVVLGIDKVIPALSDLPGFLALLTRSASGQPISSYVTMVTGPRREGEEEGPEELHVILVDNGRSTLARTPFREMLHCLHCGSCLNVCPVYRTVGGHAYESVYPGPMGDVLSPLLWGLSSYPDLPHACTLCGRCAEVCPMRIPLPDFHRGLRGLQAEEARTGGLPAWTAARASAPATYRLGLAILRGVLGRPAAARTVAKGKAAEAWKLCRDIPRPEPGPTFREWWRGKKAAGR